MIRKEPERGGGGGGGGGGRRPLLAAFVGNNRQMLNDIRDSLSHLRKSQLEADGAVDVCLTQGKAELSQSTPNLADKAAAPSATSTATSTPGGTKKGLENHTKTLAEIRETLRPFQNAAGGRERPQGSGDGDITRSNIQQIMTNIGVDEDIAVRALKLCSCNVDNAEQVLCRIIESRNGSSKISAGLPSYPINRRPSFESKYGPSSPAASETNSVRSDSPSLTNVPLSARPALVNGHQTPPPLPPRAPISTHPSSQPPGTPQTHVRGHTPPPPYSQGEANSAALNGPGTQASSADIPAGHVQQMIKRMSPGQFRTQVMQSQAAAAAAGGGGGGGGGGGSAGGVGGGGMGTQGLHQQRGGLAGMAARQAMSSPGFGPQGAPSSQALSATLSQHLQHSLAISQQGITQQGIAPQQQGMTLSPSSTSSSASSTPALSGSRLTISLSHSPPPPYSPGPSLLHKAVEQSHLLGARLDPSLALLSPHDPALHLPPSPSLPGEGGGVGVGVGSGGGGRGPALPVVADRRRMAPHAPVIMHSVKSKEVHKPLPQTATAPRSPPPPATPAAHTHSFISQVQAQVNMTPTSAAPVTVVTPTPTPPTSTPVPTTTTTTAHTRNLQIHITGQAPHHVVHSHPHATPQYATEPLPPSHHHHPPHHHPPSHHPPHQQHPQHPHPQYPAAAHHPHPHPHPHPHHPHHHPRPTLQIHIPSSVNPHSYHHPHPHHPHLNLAGLGPYDQLYGRAHSDTVSTPRSDSPVSRTTSQSPLSMMSTTSSPSTNSDIPDKPPPPYPYSLHHPHPHPHPQAASSRQPPLPPRVPYHQSKPPPPPPPAGPGIMLHVPVITGPPPPHPHPLPPPASSSCSSSTSSSSCPRVQIGGGGVGGLSAHPTSSLPPPPSSISTTSSSAALNGQTTSSNETASEQGEDTDTETVSSSDTGAVGGGREGGGGVTGGGTGGTGTGGEKHRCMSPMPERKPEAWERDRLQGDTKVRNYSPQAFKFYMEQHVENVLKIHQQRLRRRTQLENEMAKVNLSQEAAHQMRRMLHQKESNYIRLKRAKMDKSMFEKIKTLGVGAFGEVALCRKRDTGMLYAMKTLRKSDVLKRNQVAHVKAERDILAEADNEWVVKLYYSFQDHNFLYFVMDYVPGGDLMGLLIRMEILEEPLARFYVAELVQAIESVHRMGFIHRDIKPDNILIDRKGHIKLTDFGLCTGFRWTHNSKYYQGEGTHARQDSMEVKCQLDEQCQCEILKPLERRRKREQRCLAHSLVGTPNYIAPEVLLRSAGYTSVCDWWSVGVILYEMLVGRPPFYANTPAETQYKVINWKDTLKIPRESNLTQAAKDLIIRLCCGPEERLGLNGAGEIKTHPFFSGSNFETLRKQQPPYVPNIRYATDTSNFDPVDPDKLRNSDSEENKKVEKLENGKHPEHAFFEFTFRRFFDDGGHPMATTLEDPDTNSPVYV